MPRRRRNQPRTPAELAELAQVTRRWAARIEAGNARAIRRRAGLGYKAVAQVVGVHHTSVIAWETGEHQPREPAAAARWLDLLDRLEREQAAAGEDQDHDGAELAPTGTEGGARAAP
jgi:DNA-binding transcriptional regulator YiaG